MGSGPLGCAAPPAPQRLFDPAVLAAQAAHHDGRPVGFGSLRQGYLEHRMRTHLDEDPEPVRSQAFQRAIEAHGLAQVAAPVVRVELRPGGPLPVTLE